VSRKLLQQVFLILMAASFFNPVILLAQRIDGTNTAYQEGDWLSFTECRYVNSLQVAPGIVYVATEGGILRYDYSGREWLFPFTMSNGLADNRILAVAFDVANNRLWCATPTAICCYNPVSRIWQNQYLDDLGLALLDPVLSIGFDPDGLWLETRSGQQYHSAATAFSLSLELRQADSSVIWFGVRGFTPFPLPTYFLPNSLLFVDDAAGYAIQDDNLRYFRLSVYEVDPWQILWAGTNGLGMFTADTRVRQLLPLHYGLLNPDVGALLKTGQELWLGGTQADGIVSGVTRWETKSDRWSYYEPRYITHFRNADILAIAATGESIWFGTIDGLIRYQPEKNRWSALTVFDGLQDNQINCLVGEDSLLWVGSKDGLDCISLLGARSDSLRIRPITQPRDKAAVYDVFLDGFQLYAGTDYGLFFYDRQQKISGYYRGADGPGTETVVAVDRLGDSLWVATLHTVEIYDLKNKFWRGGPGRKIFINTNLTDLTVSENAVWVGSEDGLFKHKVRQGYWKQFTPQDGLLHSRVQKLLIDDDYLWIGSPAGLTRFYWNSPYRVD